MALFGSKKKKDAPAATAKAVSGGARDLTYVLRHARITEKATDATAAGVYVFDIATRATKRDIMHAVKALYNVTPRKVAVVTIPTKMKKNAKTGRSALTTGGKKAYVYLKSGETITIA